MTTPTIAKLSKKALEGRRKARQPPTSEPTNADARLIEVLERIARALESLSQRGER